MHHRAVFTHDFAECRIGHAAVGGARVKDGFERGEAHDDGGAHRSKAYGEAVEHKADDGCGRGGKTEGEQEWGGECRGSAETGCAFDEGGEHVPDDDRLNALVTADVLHPILDGFHASAFFQREEDQDGAEDDDENADGRDDALQRQSGDVSGAQAPDKDAADGADKPRERHGSCCGPSHADHEDERHKNGQNRYHSKQFNGHNDSFTLDRIVKKENLPQKLAYSMWCFFR